MDAGHYGQEGNRGAGAGWQSETHQVGQSWHSPMMPPWRATNKPRGEAKAVFTVWTHGRFLAAAGPAQYFFSLRLTPIEADSFSFSPIFLILNSQLSMNHDRPFPSARFQRTFLRPFLQGSGEGGRFQPFSANYHV